MPRMDKLSPYRTAWYVDDAIGRGFVQYAQTLIVEWNANTITLRTGGWRSVTTKRKMNQASHQFGLGYGVHQRKGEWYVSRWDHAANAWTDEKPFDGDMFVFVR